MVKYNNSVNRDNEGTETSQDNRDTDREFNGRPDNCSNSEGRNSKRNLNYVSELDLSAGDCRDSTSDCSHSDSPYCFAGNFQFFSDLEQRHYKVLNKFVFSVLSTLQPQESETIPIGDSLPTYNYNIYKKGEIYDDAILHMKKEKGEETLDVLIENYKKKIKEVNEKTYEISQEINKIIEEKLNEFGYQPKDPTIQQIRSSVNIQLKEMRNSMDVHIWAQENKPNIAGDEKASQCLSEIVKQEEVLESMFIIRGQVVQIRMAVRIIRERASPISEAIENKYYTKRADCCPTYFSVIRRFF